MARDGDIIEVMFGWMVSLIGWIFKGIFFVFVWLIKGAYSLISGKNR